MRVLVTVATKHGSTSEIAQAIRASLTNHEIEADVRSIDTMLTLEGYDAVVLGSAVYMGHWLEPAKRFIQRLGPALLERPVWLFSSGPLGDPAKPDLPPAGIDELIWKTGAREHVVFPGSLDKHELGFAERAIVAAVKAPEGDFRPWDEIDAWAVRIAAVLSSRPEFAVPA